jgi:hypothetical protein
MDTILKRLGDSPIGGIFSLLMVWFGLALGHTQVVLQHSSLPMGLLDTSLSWILGFGGFALVWIGLKRPEEQATILGYIGGSLIWCGFFEWTWRYFGHWLGIEPIMDQGMMILSPELLMIQATTLIVLSMLIFLGANKDTRCRMFMWFHRNFKLRPGRQTAGYKRQHARTAAIETVFLVWTIYLFAIFINDRLGHLPGQQVAEDSRPGAGIPLCNPDGQYLLAADRGIRTLGAVSRDLGYAERIYRADVRGIDFICGRGGWDV